MVGGGGGTWKKQHRGGGATAWHCLGNNMAGSKKGVSCMIDARRRDGHGECRGGRCIRKGPFNVVIVGPDIEWAAVVEMTAWVV